MKLPWFALSLMFVTFLSFAGDKPADSDPIFRFSDWGYARERKTITGSNRVTGDVKLRNASKDTVKDVSVSIVYSTGLGEKVAGPIVQKVGAMKAGETKTLTFVAELVPVFQNYSLTIQYNGNKKEEWAGNSDTAQPEPRSGPIKGEVNVVILGKEAAIDKSGQFSATLHIKNEGTEAAKNCKVFVTFYDLHKKKIKEWSGPLGDGNVAGGADKNIDVNFPGAPRVYAGYTIGLKADEANPEAALAGGDFAGANDIEFAHFKFDAKASGYHVTAECRNGLSTHADHIKLSLIFYGPKHRELKRFTHEIVEMIPSGGLRTINFDIPGLPAYEEYEQNISYSARESAPAKKTAAASEIKFENKPDVEVVIGSPTENADKSIRLSGGVRNGRKNAVKDVTIKVTLLNESGKEVGVAEKMVPGVIEPSEKQTFNIDVTKPFARFNYEFKFSPGESAPEKKEKRSAEDALKLAI